MAALEKGMKRKINPRSTGRTDKQAYHKTTVHLGLSQEALELRRCKTENIRTQHVFPAEFLGYSEGTNTLSTKKIDGRELFHILWNSTCLLGRLRGSRLKNSKLLFARIEELGSWLHCYHQSSMEPEADGHAALWLKISFEAKLNHLQENGVLTTKFIDRVKKRFVDPLSFLMNSDYLIRNQIQTCQVHGDFIIYNILIDGLYNAHVLDFGDTRRATNIEDLARMYSVLWAISKTNETRKRLFTPLLSKFLNAYGKDQSITQTEFFKCNLAYNYIVHLKGQQALTGHISRNSMREIDQISQVGIKWITQEI